MAPDISSQSQRQNFSTLIWKGKVVLVDWVVGASHVEEQNPHVVEMYNKYNSKGFIFSVLAGWCGQQGWKTINRSKNNGRIDYKELKDAWLVAIDKRQFEMDTWVWVIGKNGKRSSCWIWRCILYLKTFYWIKKVKWLCPDLEIIWKKKSKTAIK